MRSPGRLLLGALVVVVAAAGSVVGGVAAPVAAAPTAGAAPAAAPPAVRTVSLITGDTVRVGSGAGPATVTVLPRDRHGAAGSFRTVRRGDSVSVLPALAVPYLGRELDPALFDVTALAAAPAGRLPVRIAYRAGAGHRALPGVTVTGTSGDVATGYLTAGLRPRLRRARWPRRSAPTPPPGGPRRRPLRRCQPRSGTAGRCSRSRSRGSRWSRCGSGCSTGRGSRPPSAA